MFGIKRLQREIKTLEGLVMHLEEKFRRLDTDIYALKNPPTYKLRKETKHGILVGINKYASIVENDIEKGYVYTFSKDGKKVEIKEKREWTITHYYPQP